MEKLKVFTSFSGVGSQEMALENIGVDYEVVGISEVDRYALLSYDAIHNEQAEVEIEEKTKEEMLKEFESKHIAYNFSTGESETPRNIQDITKLYNAHIRCKNFGDISIIDENSLPDFDLFTYSFPCVSVSVAGKQEGFEKESNTSSSLLWECERIIKHKKPKYLMMENVKGLLSDKFIGTFNVWLKVLEKLGYKSWYKVLNGKDFGVPQNRERVICISVLKSENKDFRFPKSVELENNLHDILEKEVDEKYFKDPSTYEHLLKDSPFILPNQDISYSITANYWKGINVDGFINRRRNQLVQIGLLHQRGKESIRRVYDSRGISPTLTAMQGGDRQPKVSVYPILTPDRIEKRQNGRRCKEENDTMFTLTVQDKHGVVLKDTSSIRIRRLTPLECWRLMGFSDIDYYKAKDLGGLSETKLYERAGNGIIVPMLEKVFSSLLYPEYTDNKVEVYPNIKRLF